MASSPNQSKEIHMVLAVAQNTDSETLMSALPAFRRTAKRGSIFKMTFLRLLQYWLTFKEGREKLCNKLGDLEVKNFLEQAASERDVTDEEDAAIKVIAANWKEFGPAEFLLGCD